MNIKSVGEYIDFYLQSENIKRKSSLLLLLFASYMLK